MVIVQMKTINKTHLIVVAAARKDLGGGRKLLPPKHLLQTTPAIVFLEKNVDFHQHVCAGYEFSKSNSL
jgi:hypothetical protein